MNQLEECNKREISVDDSVVPEEFEEEVDVIVNAVTYRERYPCGRHFELIYKNIFVSPEVQNYPQNDPDNIAYTPQIVEFLLTYYMPLLPLWSGIILRTINSDGNVPDSNAIVENLVQNCQT